MRRPIALVGIVAVVVLGLLGGGVQATGARAAAVLRAVAEPGPDGGGGPDHVRALDPHMAPSVAERIRTPIDVRGLPTKGPTAARRLDRRPAGAVDRDRSPRPDPRLATGIRRRGPPTTTSAPTPLRSSVAASVATRTP